MIDTTLAHLIHSLRQNQVYLAKVTALLLGTQTCLIMGGAVVLYAAATTQFVALFSAAMLGLASLQTVVAIHLMRELSKNDLILPSE